MELSLDLNSVKSGETVAVALSGGRDSMALLYSLLSQKEKKVIVRAIHVEHGIRGDASVEDENFVRNECKRLGVELFVRNVNALSGRGSLEEVARRLRYSVFNEALDGGFCDYVATAHHRKDNAETVLMRIFRGTGIGGLVGIKAVRGRFIRPLVGVSREEIERYVFENKIPYRDDATNDEDGYSRNYIRKNILPIISAKFPAAEENIERLSRLSAEADEYIARESVKLLKIEGKTAFISLPAEPILIKYAVKASFVALGVEQDIEERHLLLAAEAAKSGRKTYDFPFGFRLEREENALTLSLPEHVLGECPAKIGENRFSGKVIRIEKTDRLIPGKLCFSTDLNGVVLRGKREGDRFRRFGGGEKSLGDYLTDIKMPARKKDSLVLLARGSEILVVCGVEISENVKIKSDSGNGYYISQEEENV